jgi:hypothetical protein
MKFKFITCAYIVGEFALYILVALTSTIFVVVYVSTIDFICGSSFVLLDHIKYILLYAIYFWISCILVSIIHYINPLVEIVINYQNWGDCKGKLPLSVFLVIDDNHYGLMFSLSFL